MAQPPAALTVEQLRTQVRDGAVDTVVVAFLASDEASFVTGSVILADGAMTAQ